MIRRLAPLALVALSLTAAACSSSASSDSTTTGPTTTAKPATTTTASVAWCGVGLLTITAGSPSGAAGHVQVPLVFKNTSAASCVTGGFPGVAGTNSSGSQVIQAARVGSSNGRLTLAPGASATATVSAVDVPSGNETTCPTLSGLVVTPPNTVKTAQVIVSLPGCAGMSVTAMTAS